MEKEKTKKARKRKRVKLECSVCFRQFDDDYRAQHNRTFHSGLISQHKAIPYKIANLSKDQAAINAFLTKTTESLPSTTAHTSAVQKDLTETDAPASNETSLSVDNMMEIEQQATDVDLENGPSGLATESGPDCTPFTVADIEENLFPESGSDSEFIQPLDKEPLSWLTCAGELSYLVEDLTTASKLLEDVKGENCPLVAVFLTNAEEITRKISENALKVNKTCNILMKEMDERKKKEIEDSDGEPKKHPHLRTIQRIGVK